MNAIGMYDYEVLVYLVPKNTTRAWLMVFTQLNAKPDVSQGNRLEVGPIPFLQCVSLAHKFQ